MLAQHPALVIILLPTWTLWFIVWLGLAASRCSGTGRHYFSKVEVLGEEKCIPVAVLLTRPSCSFVFSTRDIFLCLSQEATKDSAGVPKTFS